MCPFDLCERHREVRVAVKNEKPSVEEAPIEPEAQGTRRPTEFGPLVDVTHLEIPTGPIADKPPNLVTQVSNAVEDMGNSLLRQPTQLEVGERAAGHLDEA